MFKTQVVISSSTYETSSPVLYLSRLWGIAPYSIQKQHPNYSLKLSPGFLIYSYGLATILVTTSLHGLVSNLLSEWEEADYVILFGIALGDLVTITLILGAPFRTRLLYGYLHCVEEIDKIFKPRDAESIRKTSVVSLLVIMGATAVLIGSWQYSLASRNIMYILQFLPDNLQQTFLPLTFQCLYAHAVYCLEKRIVRLNGFLRDNCRKEESNRGKGDSQTVNLPKVYNLICNSVNNINRCFGFPILVISLSCMLGVTESFYYTIYFLFKNYSYGNVLSQVVWSCFHLSRLFILVEPCERCLNQVDETFNILAKSSISGSALKLDDLLTHMTYRRFEFSIFGLGTVNRRFLTHFLSSVVTYLVIILQLNQTFRS